MLQLKSTLFALCIIFSSSVFANNDLANGAEKFKVNCQICHGIKGHGDGINAASLPKRPANIAKKLSKPFKLKYFLLQDVLGGKQSEGMPAFANVLTKQDVYDIFAYVESVQ